MQQPEGLAPDDVFLGLFCGRQRHLGVQGGDGVQRAIHLCDALDTAIRELNRGKRLAPDQPPRFKRGKIAGICHGRYPPSSVPISQ
ncbi:hypothetical protein BMS3Bbin10_01922 [bacterium BMS3Bbin10]|nr:hypothetical protein BMS3Bbin10_01922 [bacterium BMS3Bbin10]